MRASLAKMVPCHLNKGFRSESEKAEGNTLNEVVFQTKGKLSLFVKLSEKNLRTEQYAPEHDLPPSGNCNSDIMG